MKRQTWALQYKDGRLVSKRGAPMVFYRRDDARQHRDHGMVYYVDPPVPVKVEVVVK